MTELVREVSVFVDHDAQPEQIAERFARALRQLGIDVQELPSTGAPSLGYKLRLPVQTPVRPPPYETKG